MALYIKFDNLQGDVTHKTYKGHSLVHSMHLPIIRNGASNAVGNMSHHNGSLPEFALIQIIKPVDSVTPNIFAAACHGHVFKEVKIIDTGINDIDVPFIETTLKNVRVADYGRSSQEHGSHPREVLHLTYSSIAERYSGTNGNGSLKTTKAVGFDLATVKGL